MPEKQAMTRKNGREYFGTAGVNAGHNNKVHDEYSAQLLLLQQFQDTKSGK